MGQSQNNYTEWGKKKTGKRIYTVGFHLYTSRKYKIIYSDKKQITGYLGMVW